MLWFVRTNAVCWVDWLNIIEDGKIVTVRPPDPDADDSDVDITSAVADSVEVSMEDEEKETNNSTSEWNGGLQCGREKKTMRNARGCVKQ